MQYDLSRHILFKKYKKVQSLCAPLLKLGISGFIYMRRYLNGEFIDLSNQLEWTGFFLEKYLKEQYPITAVENHMLSEKGMLLWSVEPDNMVWKEGAELFGFGNGISIHKKRNEYCEIFCFYGKSSDYFLNNFFTQSFTLLDKFLKYFMENMESDIAMACEANDLLITPQSYLQSTRRIILEDYEKQFLEELDKYANRKSLSERERECVVLCSNGKTAKEIARHLNLSPRTVETHFANAKQKLGCKNIQELIYKISSQKDSVLESGLL